MVDIERINKQNEQKYIKQKIIKKIKKYKNTKIKNKKLKNKTIQKTQKNRASNHYVLVIGPRLNRVI